MMEQSSNNTETAVLPFPSVAIAKVYNAALDKSLFFALFKRLIT